MTSNRPDPLDAALSAVRDDEREWGASRAVEAQLLAAVQASAREPRLGWRLMLAAAALLVVAVTGPLWRLSQLPGGADAAQAARQEIATPFYPLLGGDVPETGGQLVRMELPRTALARFGLESTIRGSGGATTILADVLVTEEGLARAVRFVTVAPGL